MKAIFNAITSIAVRFRILTFALAILFLALGVFSWTDLNQELLPPIELPQTIILAQASGMTSDQVLSVLTERLEGEIADIEAIINIESQTTGAFGAVITAYNNFGDNQDQLIPDIQAAVDRVWLPTRTIQAEEGDNTQNFAAGLLSELQPETLIFIAQRDANFLFQLSPEVWNALSDETIRTSIAYLARQEAGDENDQNALSSLVTNEVLPQILEIASVANVLVSGGQALPGAENNLAIDENTVDSSGADSLLLNLSPAVWDIIASRFDDLSELDETVVQILLNEEVSSTTEPPILPESWQTHAFKDATDLLELGSLTRTLADVFNEFATDGRIIGALGQTDDLTPEIIEQMLAIDPTLVEYFEAEHLTAMTPDVFASLPDDYIASLDGFTRDALAAAALASQITGLENAVEPVELPSPWRIQPPQIITFSFADLPLATFTVASTEAPSTAQAPADADEAESTETAVESETSENDEVPESENVEIPEGPRLPLAFTLAGNAFGVTLDTADDLIKISIPEELAEQSPVPIDTLSAGLFLSLLADPGALSGDGDAPALPIDTSALLSGLTPEIMQFIAEYDDNFISELTPAVYDALPNTVILLPEFAPPLADAWNVLSQQPQFSERPLETAADIVALGNGEASSVLNGIDQGTPERFSGYEVRLFDSLTPATLRYFLLVEPNFNSNLSAQVLLKMSAETLEALPEEFFEPLDEQITDELATIIAGEQPSAFDVLEEELYSAETIPADPTAPVLNPEWQTIAGFIQGVREFNNAFDLFRYPQVIGTPAEFINSLFDTSQGRNFAPNLLGNLSIDAFEYIEERSTDFVSTLLPDAIVLLPDNIQALLPQDLVEQANAGERFVPSTQITRTNGAPSLLVTVFKTQDANTVSTYAAVEDAITAIDEANEQIIIGVAFEQSSFIEDSIEGVAREGTLGAIFAIVIILIFLSGGVWASRPRRIVGIITAVVFIAGLAGIVFLNLEAANNDFGQAFADADTVLRLLFIVGILSGIFITLWPRPLPDPAWRATLVIAVSIPLSILSAFVAMRWISPAMYNLISPLADGSAFFTFVLRLFPEEVTLNIMTLSGLTVAVGRVVDDSIVVLENIFKQLQAGEDKKQAILSGTRDVSAAIFVATLIAVVVFLPLGLTGGIIGAFFLPFGLAVTYALAGSFITAITVVPALAYIFISLDDMPEEDEDFWLARFYTPILRFGLSNAVTISIVILLAVASAGFGAYLFSQRPSTFLPDFGEPQIAVNVELPPSASITETDALTREFEQMVKDTVPEELLGTVQSEIGGSGLSFEALITGGNVSENRANITIGLDVSPEELDIWTQELRAEAVEIYGEENVVVSAASVASGGFGGFSLVVSGPQEVLAELDAVIIQALSDIDGITNVSSNLTEDAASGDSGSATYIRVNQQTAISYSAELETEDTLGVTAIAIETIESLPNLPEGISVSQGFESEIQTEGFQSLGIAIGIALMIVIAILFITFGSPVYWLAIIFSVITAPVGAAIALTLTDRVLGISAMIGLLMLLGLVITNAVVLLDRVRSNMSERGMTLYDALIEAGARRLRPILMTSLATIIALMPLTVGLSEGAIIAKELGTVVVGGVFSSTLLTLLVVPIVYYVLTPIHRFLMRLVGVKTTA